jgi:hypothetical protein
MDEQFLPPSATHWLGTDNFGRDLLTRILYGARISLVVGIVPSFISLVIGAVMGIVSGFFYQHSVWKIGVKGWVSQLDPKRFQVSGYYLGNGQDSETALARQLCHRFVQGPASTERWRQIILADRPHVLIYPDIGMSTEASELAALRLAPAQCGYIGHPQTSGFPTLDYFLSGELIEPANGQDHYVEKLVKLPNAGFHYEPLALPPATVTREELGLRPNATAYWCAQSLFKYLPQYDEVFPRIAREVGDCQFVFIRHFGREVTELFQKRLDRAFAAAGLKDATTGDTVCDPKAPILLERIDTYEPVISQAIEADNAAAKERMDFALGKMTEEDPTFRVKDDPDTGQTLISGMGELHLEIIVDRMKREYGVQARAGKPQVVFRETVLGEGEGHAVFERDLKEQAIYGEATCKVRSRPRGSGMDFKRALPAASLLPDTIVAAAMQGLKDAASSGPDGYPLEDVEVTLIGLTLRDGANGEIGGRAAAAEAFRRAVQNAHPSRLEPIMAVEVTVDDEFLGAVIGDLNQRRGQVQDVGSLGAKRLVAAHVPLRNMFGYSTRLRSLTEGRATFSMLFHAYDTLQSV